MQNPANQVYEEGVLIWVSTGESNRKSQQRMANYWHDYEVYFVPGIYPSQVCGNCSGGRMVGQTLRQYDADVLRYPTLQEYITKKFYSGIAPPPLYDAWAGFSARHFTFDERYHAVDLYIKSPDMLLPPVSF